MNDEIREQLRKLIPGPEYNMGLLPDDEDYNNDKLMSVLLYDAKIDEIMQLFQTAQNNLIDKIEKELSEYEARGLKIMYFENSKERIYTEKEATKYELVGKDKIRDEVRQLLKQYKVSKPNNYQESAND